MMRRRDFIRTAALGTLAISAQLSESLFASPYGKPVGIQLYTLRDQLEKDVAGTIQQVGKIGYKEAEIYSLYGKSPAEFTQILSDNGIAAVSGHYMLKDVKGNWNQKVEDAKTLGLKYMVNAILQPDEHKSFDDYKRLVDVFNQAGEVALIDVGIASGPIRIGILPKGPRGPGISAGRRSCLWIRICRISGHVVGVIRDRTVEAWVLAGGRRVPAAGVNHRIDNNSAGGRRVGHRCAPFIYPCGHLRGGNSI